MLTDNEITYRVIVQYNFITREAKCTFLHPNGVDIISGNEWQRLHTIFAQEHLRLILEKQDKHL
jgi:hypothetical protein